MKKNIIIFTTLLFILVMGYSIYKKEKTLADGLTVNLPLAPVDPRSIMQGDYMRLNFVLTNTINKELKIIGVHKSRVVLKLDKNKIGTFKSFDMKTELTSNEMIFQFSYAKKFNRIISRLSTTNYLFQEGKAKIFEQAKYGKFKVSKTGEALLVNLLDKDLKIIK